MGKVKDYSKKKEIFNAIMKEDYLTKLKLFGEDIVRKEINEYLKNL